MKIRKRNIGEIRREVMKDAWKTEKIQSLIDAGGDRSKAKIDMIRFSFYLQMCWSRVGRIEVDMETSNICKAMEKITCNLNSEHNDVFVISKGKSFPESGIANVKNGSYIKEFIGRHHANIYFVTYDRVKKVMMNSDWSFWKNDSAKKLAAYHLKHKEEYKKLKNSYYSM